MTQDTRSRTNNGTLEYFEAESHERVLPVAPVTFYDDFLGSSLNGDDATVAEAAVAMNATVPGGSRTADTLSAYLANNATFNVKDYGATGDGATDDIAAFVAAEAAAAAVQGTIIVPAGTYCVSGEILLSRGVSIVGEAMPKAEPYIGPIGSILHRTADCAILAMRGTNRVTARGGSNLVRGLWFEETAAIATTPMIDGKWADCVRLEDLMFTMAASGQVGDAIYHHECWDWRASNCIWKQCGRDTTANAITSLTRVGLLATVTTTAPHGLTTGDRIDIEDAAQAGYNLQTFATVTGASTFTFPVLSTTLTTPATGTITWRRPPKACITVYNGAVDNSNDFHLHNCRFQETDGVSLYFDSTGAGNRCTEYKLTDCKFEDARAALARMTRCHVYGEASHVRFVSPQFGGTLVRHVHAVFLSLSWTIVGAQFANNDSATAVECVRLEGSSHKVIGSHFSDQSVTQYVNVIGGANVITGCTRAGTAPLVNAAYPKETTLLLNGSLGINIPGDGLGSRITYVSSGDYWEIRDGAGTTTRIGGTASMGGTPSAAMGWALSSGLVLAGATSQYGYFGSPTFNEEATSTAQVFCAQPRTKAAVFTLPTLSGFRALDAVKGAGSTVSHQIGLDIDNQTQGGTNTSIRTGSAQALLGGPVQMSSRFFSTAETVVNQTGGGTITPALATTNRYVIVVGDSTAFTIGAPSGNATGQEVVFEIFNNSGGAMGGITWNSAWKMDSSFAVPASTKRCTIRFTRSGSAANYVQVGAASGDIG